MAETEQRARTGADVLREIGVVAIPRAVDQRICSGLIRDMSASASAATTMISERTMERELMPSFARSTTVEGSPLAQATIELVLAFHRPRLEEFFQAPLDWNREIHFLTYNEGDFIVPHCDVVDGEGVLGKVRERLALFSIFLNGRGSPPDETFAGGEFVLHPSPERDLAVTCQAGTLIAFKSNLVHSVRPIVKGVRHSVAGWFRAGPAEA